MLFKGFKIKRVLIVGLISIITIFFFIILLSMVGANSAIGGAGEQLSKQYKDEYGKEIDWNDPKTIEQLESMNSFGSSTSGSVEDTSKWVVNKGFKNSMANKLGFSLPLKSAVVTATSWYYPASFGGGWHPGIDLAAPSGNKIYAPADGKMVFRNNAATGYGIHMATAHQVGNDVYAFLYGHMSRQGSNNGTIKKGEVIGYVGSTGNSTGPHVHFEVFKIKNATVEKVVSQNKYSFNFGLSYNGTGDCNSICRFKPHEFLGLNLGTSW